MHDLSKPPATLPDLDLDLHLRLDDLHPLIRETAYAGWVQGDFTKAVGDAYFALRELLSSRLGEDADEDAHLVNMIGEDKDQIPLPFTRCVSQTDKNMHRGVVNFLRGLVFYVRNPIAHGWRLAAEDRVAAFERLAIMSLCARHVELAVRPGLIDDVIAELLEERFPHSTVAYADLIGEVPRSQLPALATAVQTRAVRAYTERDVKCLEKLRRFYPLIFNATGWENSMLEASVRELGALIRHGETLPLAIMLLPGPVFHRLAARHQKMVTSALVDQARVGGLQADQPAVDFTAELSYLFRRLPQRAQSEIVDCLEVGLRDPEYRRAAWSLSAFVHLSRYLTRDACGRLARAAATAVVEDNFAALAAYIDDLVLSTAKVSTISSFRNELEVALREYQGLEFPGAMLAHRVADSLSAAQTLE